MILICITFIFPLNHFQVTFSFIKLKKMSKRGWLFFIQKKDKKKDEEDDEKDGEKSGEEGDGKDEEAEEGKKEEEKPVEPPKKKVRTLTPQHSSTSLCLSVCPSISLTVLCVGIFKQWVADTSDFFGILFTFLF